MTILVGPNGVGKSTILHALDFFFDPARGAQESDIHGECTAEPLEISVTFRNLLPDEEERFRDFVRDDGTLIITKRSALEQESVQYVSRRRAHEPFIEIRDTQGARQQQAMYKQFAAENKDYSLPSIRSTAEAIAALDDWERHNLDRCQELEVIVPLDRRSRTLSSSTLVRFVPAVQDAEESVDSARSPLQGIIETYIRTPAQERQELLDLRDTTVAATRLIFSPEATPILAHIEERLATRLAQFAPGISIKLEWDDPADFVRVGVPAIQIKVVEDGYGGPIGGKGHGLQRGVIFGAMRLEVDEFSEQADGKPEQHLIVLVEEPELYQHPTRARYIADLFHRMAVEEGIVLVFATHSPYFVRLEDFPAIRILRKEGMGTGIPRRSIGQTNLQNVAEELQGAHQPAVPFTAEGLEARIHGILDSSIREGYFARRVVLCEGDEDIAFVYAACRLYDVDLDGRDVAVLSANGKDALDRTLVIFRQLGIPTYVLFDADSADARAQNAHANRALLALLGAASEDFPATQIESKYAVWHDDMQRAVRGSFPAENDYANALREVAESLGYRGRDPKKNPAAIRRTLEALRAVGKESTILRNLAAALETFARA